MPLHVRFWQFDADCKALDDKNDSGAFEGDLVCISPCQGIEEICRMWTKYDATYGSYSGFADVESFLHEEGYEHEQTGEASNDEVRPMRLVDRQLVPRHLSVLTVEL